MITLPTQNVEVQCLENGLEVLLLPDSTHPLVSVQLWIRAGSIHEEGWSGAGLAHLVEHMFFKGTKHRDATQISQEIQANGGYVNAYTTYNRTVYWIDGLANHVENYVEILADMAMNSLFDPKELEKEQEVIRREFAMDLDDPQAVLQHLLQITAFREHPLKHPIMGHLDVFNQVKHEDLMRFIAKHYIPNQCFLVVAGDVDRSQVLTQIEQSFGAWQRKPFAPVCFPVEAEQTAPRTASRRFNTEITRLSWGWRIGGENHPDRPALEILGMILGTGRSSRLTRRLREDLALVSWVGAGPWCIEPFGLFGIEAECEEEDLQQVEAELNVIIVEICEKGVTQSEVDKAIRGSLAQALKSRSTVRGMASGLAYAWLSQGSVEADRVYLEKVSKLTPEEIHRIARQYLLPEKLTKVTLLPELEGVEDEVVATPSLKGDISLHELPNGWRVILGKNPKLPLVSTRIQFLGGLLTENPETLGLTQIAAQWLMKGTKSYSAHELAAVLEDRGGNLFATGDLQRLVLGADSLKGDERLAWSVLSSLIHEYTLPAEELPKLIKRQLLVLQEDEEDPLTLALHQTREKVFQGSAYEKTAIGTRESLKKLQREEVHDFLVKTLPPQRGVISVFGDIEENEVLESLREIFHQSPCTSGLESEFASVDSKGEPGVWSLELDKEQAVLVLGFRSVGFQHEDAPALQLLDEACSDMGSRLFSRIREDLGLAYYVGTQAFHAMGAGAFYFYVGTDPEQLNLVEAELKSLIATLVDEGLSADELARAKKAAISTWRKGQQGNGPMADTVGWDELNGFGYRRFQNVPAILEKVSVEKVQEVIRRYLILDQSYLVKISP